MDNSKVAENIRVAMARKKWSVTDLAREAGVSRGTASVACASGCISRVSLVKIAAALGEKVATLQEGAE